MPSNSLTGSLLQGHCSVQWDVGPYLRQRESLPPIINSLLKFSCIFHRLSTLRPLVWAFTHLHLPLYFPVFCPGEIVFH